ncbi:MAG: adaptor protein MecA [Firmicutes bacterium]|nr:adaptor protein MecA [Bacillota bacterium]
MKIEKLNENKIRIILNLDDLKEKNIDFHSFMSNSLESQDLFLDMLDKAEEQFGFITKDYKLIIEAIATSDGNFILTVTRIIPSSMPSATNKDLQVRRKLSHPSKALSIYSFNSFDDFCEFCTYLDSSPFNKLTEKLKKSSLYLYNQNYFLILGNVTLSLKDFKTFHCMITEFATYIIDSNIFASKLAEYGRLIIKSNAINTCIKHFK